MKTNTTYRRNSKIIRYTPRKASFYPNAATPRELLNKALDYALTAATSAGIVTILVCLFTFF
ncbi:MAG: hypothetical protein IJF02_02340 [Oscillospiraceae bacterium]|nr:hypothetical protein [Oscillospiraceae bacterium]